MQTKYKENPFLLTCSQQYI